MRNTQFYSEFAAEWIAAWNEPNLERVLSLYDDSFKFSSPLLAKLVPDSGGELKGKDAVAAYWSRALAARPELHFDLINVFKGVDSVVVHYRDHRGKFCAEFFVFGNDGKVIESHAQRE